MWVLKKEYEAAWPQLLSASQSDIIIFLALRGGWITEGIEGDKNYFTDKFEFIKAAK